MMFIAVVLFIFYLIGLVVGIIAFAAPIYDYPKMNKDTNTYDIIPTAKFFLLMGPLFWIVTGFYFFFKWGFSLLEDKDE